MGLFLDLHSIERVNYSFASSSLYQPLVVISFSSCSMLFL
jgi:hypothetical protein